MVGQQHVLKALINALDDDRLHHAYLFTGTRGVGKTTIARVLAKCLNCELGVTSEPCGHCGSCQEIVEGRFIDLIEVDAASRTRVEDTRELLDNVQYAPTRGRFKVYLIDEVHMLSGHSFNALLKTLEEPPPHVKFLLATTDPQKLPVTILSRCLQFNLKRMPVDMIFGHLITLLNKEKIQSDEGSLRLIARAADGSMRDALSLLDQAISFGAGELKETDIQEMLGSISHEPLVDLLQAVAAGDGQKILDDIETMAGITPDFETATDALIALLHQIAVLQVVTQAKEEEETIKQLATQLSKEDVQLYYQIALHSRRDLALSPDPRSGFEMLFLRLLTFRPLSDIAPPVQGISKKEEKEVTNDNSVQSQTPSPVLKVKAPQHVVKETPSNLSSAPSSGVIDDAPPWGESAIAPAVRLKTSERTSERINNDRPTSIETPPPDQNKPTTIPTEKIPSTVEQEKKTIRLKWYDIIRQLDLKGQAAELVRHCVLVSRDSNHITLSLDQSREGLFADSIMLEIEVALQQYYAKPNMRLLINMKNLSIETPSKRVERKQQEHQQQIEKSIKEDPFVKQLEDQFNARIVPKSVKPK